MFCKFKYQKRQALTAPVQKSFAISLKKFLYVKNNHHRERNRNCRRNKINSNRKHAR